MHLGIFKRQTPRVFFFTKGVVNTSLTISEHLVEESGTVADVVGTDASFGSLSGVMV